MTSPRIRRLKSDHEAMRGRFADSGPIRIRSTRGNPPEKYEIEFRIKSLEMLDDGRLVERSEHAAEIVLTTDYPRSAPQCAMKTPIFHPNINSVAICIGDHWAASEALPDLVQRIGEIIAYQSYNTKSPLNPEAARWTDENEHLLPIDKQDLLIAEPPAPQPAPEPARDSSPPPPGRHCANCWADAADAELVETSPGVFHCADCLVPCPACGKPTAIGEALCAACAKDLEENLTGLRAAAKRNAFDDALQTAEAILRRFPEHEEALRIRSEIEEKRKKLEQNVAEANRALDARRYVLFLRIAEKWEAAGVGFPARESVDSVREKVAAARRAMPDVPDQAPSATTEAVAACRKALELCADLPEALDLLEVFRQRHRHLSLELRKLQGVRLPTGSHFQRLRSLAAEIHEICPVDEQAGPQLLSERMAVDALREKWQALAEEMEKAREKQRARYARTYRRWKGALAVAAGALLGMLGSALPGLLGGRGPWYSDLYYLIAVGEPASYDAPFVLFGGGALLAALACILYAAMRMHRLHSLYAATLAMPESAAAALAKSGPSTASLVASAIGGFLFALLLFAFLASGAEKVPRSVPPQARQEPTKDPAGFLPAGNRWEPSPHRRP